MKSKAKSDIKYRAYEFSLDLIKFISSLPKNKILFVVSDQLLRSGTSIGANIVEGKSSQSKKEFIRYYQIALKSANETKYWLCILRDSDVKFSNKQEVVILLNEAVELSKILGSSLLTLRGKKKF